MARASRLRVAAIAAAVIVAHAASGLNLAAADPDTDDDDSAGSGSAHARDQLPADPKARAAWLRDKFAAAIAARPTLAHAKLGVAVYDLATGGELYAHDADAGLNLASNTKLLTSTAALSMLGGGFRWRTSVYADAIDDATGTVTGHLYLRGRGDPLLSVADLRALAADVAARGVRTITGNLVIDASYFDGQLEPPHYDEQKSETAGFRAPVASLGVARGTVTVTVIAGPNGSAKVSLDPETDQAVLKKTAVTSIVAGKTKIRVDARAHNGKLEIDVSGQIRASDGSYDVRKRLDDPARAAADVLRRALAAKGVTVRGKIATGVVPTAAKVVAVHDSQSLAVAVHEMNKYSDNYVAESVLKTLGAETKQLAGPGTWADGVAAVRAYLASIGIAAGSYRADNGSGLYGASDVSAHQVVKILAAAFHDFRIGPDLVASLPVGGVDGTLAKRWHGSAARGRVRAKTGTLDKVIALAGYVGEDGAHQLAFAIVENDIPSGQRPAARALADDMVDAMIAFASP